MVEYADVFELLQKYLVKHHPNLNFCSFDIEQIEKEMLTTEAELASAVVANIEVEVRGVEGDAGSTVPVTGDANVEQAYVFIFLGPHVFERRKTIFFSFCFQACVFWA